MKKLYFLILLTAGFYSNNSLAYFSVNQTYLLLDNRTRNVSLTVFNNDNIKHKYRVILVHYKQEPSGKYIPIKKETKEIKFADPYLIYTPMQFSIDKKAYQVIRFQKRSMANAEDGEFISYLLITELPNLSDNKLLNSQDAFQVKLTPIFNISLPIVIRKGDLKTQAKISNINIIKKDNNTHLDIVIKRTGNSSVRGDLIIESKENKKIITEIKGLNIFLGTNYREISINIDNNVVDKNNLIVDFVDPDNQQILASKDIKG